MINNYDKVRGKSIVIIVIMHSIALIDDARALYRLLNDQTAFYRNSIVQIMSGQR